MEAIKPYNSGTLHTHTYYTHKLAHAHIQSTTKRYDSVTMIYAPKTKIVENINATETP